MTLRDAVRTTIIGTNDYWPFSALNKVPYHAAIKAFIRLCKGYTQIKSVYLRSGLVESNWVPGLSDIDLTVIIDSRLPLTNEFAFLQTFWKRYARLKRLFPMFGEVDILSDQIVGCWTRFGLAGHNARNWKLVYGVESVSCNYQMESRQFSMDCLNNSLDFMHWYYRSYFGRTFFDRAESRYLLSHDLKRLASKIVRCLSHLDRSGIEGAADSSFRYSEDDAFCNVVIRLDRAISDFASVEQSSPPNNDESWLRPFSRDFREDVKVGGFGINASDTWSEALESVTVDFNNRTYLIFKNSVDASTMKRCLHRAKEILGPDSASIIVVTVRIFEYMVRYYEPYDYFHFMRHRKVFFGQDLMLRIAPPSKQAFANFLLNQVRNVLAYPQGQEFYEALAKPEAASGELSSMLDRCLFLKLYLERALVIPLPDQLRSQCEQQYPEWFAALRSFRETQNEEAGVKLFGMLRGLTDAVRRDLD